VRFGCSLTGVGTRGPSDLPRIVGGVQQLGHKSWAKYLVLPVSVPALRYLPLGLRIGAHSIWVLLQRETEKLFGPCC
jgi:hypothetical protein